MAVIYTLLGVPYVAVLDPVRGIVLRKAARKRVASPGQMSLFASNEPKQGDTKVENGVTYQLNQHSRWERTDKAKDKANPKAVMPVIENTPVQPEPESMARKKIESTKAKTKAKLLASSVNKNFRSKGHIDFIGQKINSIADIAAIAQIYRNPHHESFHYFFIKENKIVGATAIGSRTPGITFSIPENRDISSVEWVRLQMERVNADGFYVSHNHPAGKPDPSDEDISVTKWFATMTKGFKGHVVVDHHHYATIDGQGNVDLHKVDNPKDYQAKISHELLGTVVSDPKDLVTISKQLQRTDGMVTLIGQQRTVQGILAIPLEQVTEKTIKAFCKQIGGEQCFLVGDIPISIKPPYQEKPILDLIEKGYLIDAVTSEGESLHRMFDMKHNPSKRNDELWHRIAENETKVESTMDLSGIMPEDD